MRKYLKRLFRFGANQIDTPIVVLLYHRVIDLDLDPQELAVSTENFERQIEYLNREYNVLTVDGFVACVRSKSKVLPRSVVITFDDGYYDNFYNALPILAKYDSQALFYISTANIDTKKEFWWDDLERIFLLKNELPNQFSFVDNYGVSCVLKTETEREKEAAYSSLQGVLKNMPPGNRDYLINCLLEWSGLTSKGRDTHRMLTSEELCLLGKSPFAVIGAHTHHHPKLSVCGRNTQFDEIYESKEVLERTLGRRIEHFSYPFGTKVDYNDDTIEICEQLKLNTVCANYHSQYHSWHSNFEIPRMIVRNWSIDEFQQKMKTYFKY